MPDQIVTSGIALRSTPVFNSIQTAAVIEQRLRKPCRSLYQRRPRFSLAARAVRSAVRVWLSRALNQTHRLWTVVRSSVHAANTTKSSSSHMCLTFLPAPALLAIESSEQASLQLAPRSGVFLCEIGGRERDIPACTERVRSSLPDEAGASVRELEKHFQCSKLCISAAILIVANLENVSETA